MHITLAFIVILFYTLLSTSAFAITTNIYEKPSTDAKVINSIQNNTPLVPIFYTDKKDWVKVGNPKNGEVGWIKASELKELPAIVKIDGSKIQQLLTTKNKDDKGRESTTYNIIQYSGPNNLTPEEAEKAIKEMDERNKQIRVYAQKLEEQMQTSIKEAFKTFDKMLPLIPLIQDSSENQLKIKKSSK